ncbi:MAG TPA: SRPBCC family protein [Acidimicrobiia bacterium]|jgi:uncharacterized protein YndB with AHSA1/START domain
MRETTADVAVFIEDSPDRVWDALTDPKKVEDYYLGATLETDWQVGSPITWSGEWQGKAYSDKGKILALEPERKLSYSHWSPLSGTSDEPDNYHVIEVFLNEAEGGTSVRLTQSNQSGEVTDDDRKARAEYEKNWRTVLEGLKRVVEDEGEGAPPLT